METLQTKKGFTLLELLIVIAIIAILSAILIFVLNPAETLRKGRDSQRISDFATLNTAVALLITTVGTPQICYGNVSSSVWTDIPSSSAWTASCDGLAGRWTSDYKLATSTSRFAIDGTGWTGTALNAITPNSPISVLPVDPNLGKNTAGTPNVCQPTSTTPDRFYRFMCTANTTWEIDGALESTQFTATDDRDGTDGGDSLNRYEVGTALNLLD